MKISIITPVYNGQFTLDRMVGSVLRQEYTNWELIIVDDCSLDSSFHNAVALACEHPRIRVYQTPENVGPSAARNLALAHATGEVITFLDSDDEFYADYLKNVRSFIEKGDILVFDYDYVDDADPGLAGTYNPAAHKDGLFYANVATPLGIAHKRIQTGQPHRFDEGLWCLEDWEYWKRLARLGLRFVYLPCKSGLYHIRSGSRSRRPRVTERQGVEFERNRSCSSSIYSPGRSLSCVGAATAKRVLVITSSYYLGENSDRGDSLLDFLEIVRSGPAVVEVFIYYDNNQYHQVDVEDCLAAIGAAHRVGYCNVDDFCGRVIYARVKSVPVTIFQNYPKTAYLTAPLDYASLLKFFYRHLVAYQPDVLISFTCDKSSDHVGHAMMSLAKQRDVTLAYFAGGHIHAGLNDSLLNLDYCVATSRFSRDYHWRNYELNCNVLPPPVDLRRVTCTGAREPAYIVYFYPSLENGMDLVFRLIEKFGDCGKDDVRFLIVEGAHQQPWRRDIHAEFTEPKNAWVIDRPRDLRLIWSKARLLLNPCVSLEQPIGLLAESVANGVPTVTFNQGAATEVLGAGSIAICLDAVPAAPLEYRATSKQVEQWFDEISSLLGDTELYERKSEQARMWGAKLEFGAIVDEYARFLARLRPQPGPPLTPSRF